MHKLSKPHNLILNLASLSSNLTISLVGILPEDAQPHTFCCHLGCRSFCSVCILLLLCVEVLGTRLEMRIGRCSRVDGQTHTDLLPMPHHHAREGIEAVHTGQPPGEQSRMKASGECIWRGKEVTGHIEEARVTRNCGWPLRADSILKELRAAANRQLARNKGPQSYNHKEMSSTSNLSEIGSGSCSSQISR